MFKLVKYWIKSNLQCVQSIFKLNLFCQEISSNGGFILMAKLTIHIPKTNHIRDNVLQDTEIRTKLKQGT